MYKLDNVPQLHRTSWFTPAECLAYYKKPYIFQEIQIHWWDDPSKKPTHDGVVSYTKNKKGGSVNYVASAGRVTLMVPEKNCALTTQNGNPFGIKIECSPYGTDGDYKTIGELVANIRKTYGNLPLVPHSKYWNTACPGTLSLTRIDQEANNFIGDTMPNSSQAIVDATTVALMYNIGLRRDASTGEINGSAGMTVEQLARSIWGSPEWAAIGVAQPNDSIVLKPGNYTVK